MTSGLLTLPLAALVWSTIAVCFTRCLCRKIYHFITGLVVSTVWKDIFIPATVLRIGCVVCFEAVYTNPFSMWYLLNLSTKNSNFLFQITVGESMTIRDHWLTITPHATAWSFDVSEYFDMSHHNDFVWYVIGNIWSRVVISSPVQQSFEKENAMLCYI